MFAQRDFGLFINMILKCIDVLLILPGLNIE